MTPCCRHHSLTERPLLRHYWICAAHSCSSARCFNSALVILTPHNTTVAKPFATFRYYCLMCVYARLGLTVTTYQGFFLLLCKCMYSKTLRMRNVYFYARSLFEHGFLTNSRDKRLQRLAESCISKFCEGVPHCKIEHTAPHFCESFVLRCTLCGTPLLF